MAYLTPSAPREQTIVNFASLGILVPLLQKLNIANIIDRHLPTDPQAEYSHGTVLSVLLAARLNHPTALVNVADWADEHGVEYLCNIPADKLNDDRLARSLDAFSSSVRPSSPRSPAKCYGSPTSTSIAAISIPPI